MNRHTGKKQTKTYRHRQQYSGYQKGRGRVIKGKGGQIYGDRRLFDFGWWAHNAIHRSCMIELFT